MPVVFCNDEELAAKLHTLSGSVSDQVKLSSRGRHFRAQISMSRGGARTSPGRAVVAATKGRRDLLSGEGTHLQALRTRLV